MRIADGFVEVKFKPLAGREDQAGGVLWRFKDANNYYIARANALENNVSLYYVEKGRRITIKYVDAPVPARQWHTLRAEFSGRTISVVFDGKPYIRVETIGSRVRAPSAFGRRRTALPHSTIFPMGGQ